jgi:hypothetical protein
MYLDEGEQVEGEEADGDNEEEEAQLRSLRGARQRFH